MSFPQRNDPVETLTTDREHEPLGERIKVRAPRGKPHHLGSLSRECLPKLPRVQRIAVHEEVPLSSQETIHRIEEIACHLVHPQRIWLATDPDDLDLPVRKIDYEEDVHPHQPREAHHLDSKEVRRNKGAEMSADERLPRVAPLPRRGGIDPLLPQDALDRV